MSYSINITWCVEDVQHVCPNATEEQAIEVLEYVKRKHDADLGITWESLDWAYDYLFPDQN